MLDILNRAGAHVTMATIGDCAVHPMVCAGSTSIVADKTMQQCVSDTWDMIVLPGGPEGAKNLRENPQLTQLLKQQNEAKKYIAAICVSPVFILSHHNLLEHKSVTCFPFDMYTSQLNNYNDKDVVVDEHIITSKGPGTAVDFALVLVYKLFGEKKMEAVTAQIVHKK